MDRLADAHRDCALALTVAEPGDPALARYRAAALRAQGRAFLRERKHGSARASLEQALEILVHTQDPPSAAEVKFLLAQALTDVEAQRPRALGLAQEALDYYRTVDHKEFIQDILAWIHANQPQSQL